jgi:hypothetical protein
MTGMAEKRSVDIDLLESQLRKLDLVPNDDPSLIRMSTSPDSSREESPFKDQTNGKRRSVRKGPSSSTTSPGNASLYYTPESTPGKTGFKSSTRSINFRASNGFRASVDREVTPSRRLQRVSLSEEPPATEKTRYREKLRRRKAVLGAVKEALEPRGVRQSVEP